MSMTAGCSSSTGPDATTNDTEQVEEITQEQVIQAFVKVMEEAGITFPDEGGSSKRAKDFNLFLNDYVELDSSPNGLIQLQLSLDKDGNIIPDPGWQSGNQNACLEQNQNMRAAVKKLQFQFQPTSHEIQLNYMDVATGKVEQSIIKRADPDAPSWVVDALQKVWEAMKQKVTIKDRVGPCVEMDLTIEFSSEVTTDLSAENQPIVYYERVTGSFGLTRNEETNLFQGSGTVTWESYQFNGTEGDNHPSGELRVVNLQTPWGEGSTFDEATLQLQLPSYITVGTPMLTIGWPSLYSNTFDDASGNYLYTISGWETPSDEPGLVMRKENNRSTTLTVDGEQGTITENTTIEIRRE